uniref:Putative glutathione s-transferase ixodes scapularis glutathione s-transferase n=1 Tax=Ornithodoros turicata TaxID=34597 RepID=A0A2R5LH22_9ACAR
MAVDLYNINGSPPCGAVRMLAKILGLSVNVKDLDLFGGEHRKPDYVKLNPFSRVPTLVDDGFVLYESNAILYYLINKYQPDSELYPKCPKARANVDKILAAITSTIQPHYFAFFRPRFFNLKKPTEEDIAKLEDNVLRGLGHLAGDGKYAVGNSLSLADISLVAHLTLPFELKFAGPEKFPRLVSYYNTIKEELPGFEEINRPGFEGLTRRIAQLA